MLFDFLRARVTGQTILRVLELYRKTVFRRRQTCSAGLFPTGIRVATCRPG